MHVCVQPTTVITLTYSHCQVWVELRSFVHNRTATLSRGERYPTTGILYPSKQDKYYLVLDNLPAQFI
jgi:hypothetical protein